MLLRRSKGAPADVRRCAGLLLDAGADPGAREPQAGGQWYRSALFEAVERRDPTLARLLVERGATSDKDSFYHACEQSDRAFLDLLHRPGFERLVIHELDFEDAEGLAWFLDRGVDVDALGCLPRAIGRGRSLPILRMLLDAGADVDRPHPRPPLIAARP